MNKKEWAVDNFELKKQFRLIRTPNDLASFLEVSFQTLSFFASKSDTKYHDFIIDKKNGSNRIISAPSGVLLSLQKKLAVTFYQFFNPSVCTKGFVKKQDVLRNAQFHKNAKKILNVDLEAV